MNCLHIDSLLSAARDAKLSEAEQAIVDAHLQDCPACVRRMQGYVATCELLKGLGTYEDNETPPPVPETLVKRILEARKNAVVRESRHG